MRITLDATSTIPPYDQIRRQIETMAVSGVIPPGAALPSIRQLASDLGIAPATVARAFTELERAGVIATRRGRGSVVIGAGTPLPRQRVSAELRAAAEAFAQRAHQLGIAQAEALQAAASCLSALADE